MLEKVFMKCVSRIWALSLCVLLVSCGDDDVAEIAKDVENPQVAINGLVQGSEVWNILKLAITATDNEQIDKVEVFIDGQLLKSFTSAPFETEWDTNIVDDGEHVIKATAFDKDGNTASAQVSVKVKNTLLQFSVPANLLSAKEVGYILLSNEEGAQIAFQEINNGENITIKAGHSGTTFYVTEARVSKGEKDYLYLQSFSGVTRGGWSLQLAPRYGLTPIGTTSLQMINADPNHQFRISSNVTHGTFTGSAMYNVQFPIGQSPSHFLIWNINQMTYNLISEAALGESFVVNAQEVTKPITPLTINAPAGIKAIGAWIYYHFPGTDINNSFLFFGRQVDMTSGSQAIFYYPADDAFAKHSIEVIQYYEDRILFKQSLQPTLNITPLQYQFNYAYANSKLVYTASGTNVDFIEYVKEASNSVWSMFLPKGENISLPMLQLPETLQVHQSSTEKAFIRAHDVKSLTGYEGLVDLVRNTKWGSGVFYLRDFEYMYEERLIEK